MDEGDELVVMGLPQLSPICVTVSRRYILEEAIRQIRGTLHSFQFIDDDDDTVMASVKIDLPSHKKGMAYEQQMFYGEPTQLGSDAIKSASSAALAYLSTMNIITVDDVNYAKLIECQKRLRAEQLWSSILYDRAKSFQDDLTLQNTKKEEPHSSSDDNGPVINNLETDTAVSANHTPSPMTAEETLDEKPNCHPRKITKTDPIARRTLKL